ncbi:unnamed protein product [[Candida] boidinii]|uniref:3-deoxy-7-phosphoheptulonate synthase n=1 Tax=Candida boidinii TaxID=5477 RepID=A0A9W6SVE6_CANBO|nr:unnamed protein product [[Candida] boidinii]GMF99087.1 unnamed protein product [[Candida] boidinii]
MCEENKVLKPPKSWDYGTYFRPKNSIIHATVLDSERIPRVRTLDKQIDDDESNRLLGSRLTMASQNCTPIVQPEIMQTQLYPLTQTLQRTIVIFRETFANLLCYTPKEPNKHSDAMLRQVTNLYEPSIPNPYHKLMIVVGPEKIKSAEQAKFCSLWISKIGQHREFSYLRTNKATSYPILNTLLSKIRYHDLGICMNANTEDAIKQIGIPQVRILLADLAGYCPLALDISDSITPQYLSDLCSMGIVHTGNIENQSVREVVSGLSYPVGFESLKSFWGLCKATDAKIAARAPHRFMSINKSGIVSSVGTTGNSETFIVIPLYGRKRETHTDQKSNLTDEKPDEEAVKKGFNSFKIIFHYTLQKLNDLAVQFDGYRYKILVDVGDAGINPNLKGAIINEIFKNEYIYSKLLGFKITSGDFYLAPGSKIRERKRSPLTQRAIIRGCEREFYENREKILSCDYLRKNICPHFPLDDEHYNFPCIFDQLSKFNNVPSELTEQDYISFRNAQLLIRFIQRKNNNIKKFKEPLEGVKFLDDTHWGVI